jgi:regulator of replication initiation timing
MQKSNAFSVRSEQVKSTGGEDFAMIEVENEKLRRKIGEIEQTFSKSHTDFFQMSQSKFFAESEYQKYKREAQREIVGLQEAVREAEEELQGLQQQLKQRTTQTSGFSLNSG